MKPEDMIERVENLTHESYSKETWMQWFNDALQDLAPVIKLESYEEFAINGTSRDLPGDVMDIVKLKIDDKLFTRGVMGTENRNHFWVWEDSVNFHESHNGQVKLWYFRYPDVFHLGSTAPDIQTPYLGAVIIFAASRSKAPDRWLHDKADHFQDYLIRKSEIERERNRQLRQPRFAKARGWR